MPDYISFLSCEFRGLVAAAFKSVSSIPGLWMVNISEFSEPRQVSWSIKKYVLKKHFFFFSHCVHLKSMTSPELRYFDEFCFGVCDYSMKDFRRCMNQMKMPRWAHYGNSEPRTMRLSVEPLHPTHNVRRHREPVCNCGNPHCKTRTVIFQQGNYYFEHVPTSCNHFVRAWMQNAFPPRTVTCISFLKPPRYYSLVCNL